MTTLKTFAMPTVIVSGVAAHGKLDTMLLYSCGNGKNKENITLHEQFRRNGEVYAFCRATHRGREQGGGRTEVEKDRCSLPSVDLRPSFSPFFRLQ